MEPTLPKNCNLRPANAGDIASIFKLVLLAKLDPTQIRWQQFWVIEHQNTVIACGQLRNFTNVQELGSVVVDPQWRHRGLGTYLCQHLIQQATQPLYLECLGKQLATFYRKLGFLPVAWSELPPSLKPKFGLSVLAKQVLKIPVEIMKYSPPPF
jgi:amino-acid N-acetyltransferase